ncbi:MAG: PAS domain S-box protein [Acidobacteriota bacterium]
MRAVCARRWPAIFLSAVMAGILVLGYVYYYQESSRLYRYAQATLDSVATLKAQQVKLWLDERRGDGRVLQQNPLFVKAAADLVRHPEGGKELRWALRTRLKEMQHMYHYRGCLLLDNHLRVLVATGQTPNAGDPAFRQNAASVLSDAKIVLSPLRLESGSSPFLMELIVPLYLLNQDPPTPFGLVVLSVDPAHSLYPQMERWPHVFPSAESLLLHKGINGIHFLGPPKFQPKAAGTGAFRPPRDELTRAVLEGKSRILQETDYRGMSVLAVIHSIPESPWTLVSKIDRNEVLAPMRRTTAWAGWFLALLLLSLIGTMALTWRKRERIRLGEKQQALRLLGESEERFQSLFENTLLGLYRTTPSGEILLANPALCRMLGYSSPDELRAIDLDNGSFHPDYPRQAFMSQIGNEGFVRGVDARWQKKDGTFIWVRESAKAIRDKDGSIIYYEGTAEDITESKAAEAALRESEARYKLIVETSPDGIAMADLEGRITAVNEMVLKMGGFDRMDEVIGRPFIDFIAEPERERAAAELVRVAAQNEMHGVEHTLLRKDGSTFQVEWSASIVKNDDGRPTGVIANLRDITTRKSAESQLRLLGETIEQAHDAILVTDTAGSISYVNPALEKLTGYSRLELLGRNPRLFRGGQKEPGFYKGLWSSITAGNVWTGTFSNERKDGTAYEARTTVSPVRDEKGGITHFVSVMRDVTRERELEEQLQQAQKMDAVGRLASGIAHDFNNILAAILSYSDLALARKNTVSQMKGFVIQIAHSAERAATLTRRLLAFSRKMEEDGAVIQLNDCVRSISSMLERLVGESISVTTRLAEDLWGVNCNPGQIEQILVNLVVNSRDAINGSGAVVIETRNTELDAPLNLDAPEVAPGNYVQLSVADTGTGIAKDVQHKIFEPFFTTKSKAKGTGLGLSIVYSQVRSMGGTVHLYSEPGQGATFKIYLPAAELEAFTPHATMEKETYTGSERVLIAEDDPQVREVVTTVLEGLGYSVCACADLADTERTFEENAGRYDLLLTDMTMPDGDGLTLYERLKEKKPDLPVLFMTGYSEGVLNKLNRGDPAANYLQKPFRRAELSRKIREVLDPGKKVKPQVP